LRGPAGRHCPILKCMSTGSANQPHFSPPQSGQILGAVVAALHLGDQALTTKTASRYFRGAQISEKSRRAIFEALGHALVDSGVVPRLRHHTEQEMPARSVLALAIEWHADRWDQVAGFMRSVSVPVGRKDLAALSYLRLAVIDLALRVSAVLWLADRAAPDEGTPLWAQESSGSRYLRSLLGKCPGERPTREELANRLGVSDNTVDSWLDRKARPSPANVGPLADELAQRIPCSTAETLGGEIGRHYALSALCDLLSLYVGRPAVEELSTALVRFAARTVTGLREYSQLEHDDAARRQVLILILGTQFTGAEYLLRSLWRRETDGVWRADLKAAPKDWRLRLQHLAQQLGSMDEAKRLAQEEYGIPSELIDQISEQVERMVPVDLTDVPTDLEGKPAILIKGDAKFSARNRMIQFAQTRADGDVDTAIAHVRRAVQLQPENAAYHFFLGGVLGEAGHVEEAISECWISARLDTCWDRPKVEIGIILMNAGRNNEALDHLEASRQVLGEMTPHLAFNLAVARTRCDNAVGALELLDHVIAEEPDHALALDCAAHCSFATGDLKRGRNLAKKAHRLGASGTYLAWRARLHRKGRRGASV